MRAVYYVIQVDGHWKVEIGSVNLGPYSSRSEAVQTALDAAAGVAKKGHEVKILAVNDTGGWETLFPSGQQA